MAQEQINVLVEKSAYEIMAAIAKGIKDVKVAKASGGGVPAEVGAALVDAITVATELSAIGGDIKESGELFLKGLMLGGFEVVDALK